MKKIVFFVVLMFYVFNVKAIDVYSENAILYNLNDDSVLFSKGADDKIYIASLTKIMTTVVALENIDNIKEKVIMPMDAFFGLDGYAVSGIGVGDVVTYEDLLYGIMLPSGADCANAIALLLGGIDHFVSLMNNKAMELGLVNTHFSNPYGADYDNYSTVRDVSLLLKYALQNDNFYKIFTSRSYITSTGLVLSSTLSDKALRYDLDVSNILGSKTGYTTMAGYCLASISYIDGVSYLFVSANADTPYNVVDAINMYDYFSNNYGYHKVLGFNDYLTTVKVNGFFSKNYDIYSDSDVYMFLSNDIDSFSYEYVGSNVVSSKIKRGDYLGYVNVKNGNDVFYTYDVFFDEDIYEDNYYLFIIVFVYIFLIIRKKINLQS